MPHINFEFKARANNLFELEKKLKSLNPRFAGEDHQVDTYFNVPDGRLKLREGIIENALIFYKRQNVAGAKQSDVQLYPHQPGSNLKSILLQSLGVKAVVDKTRKIYFVENVKIHFDTVLSLGNFVEVEAIDEHGSIGVETLSKQCRQFAQLFGLKEDDYVSHSYGDMILEA